jgi:hypothetical protein
MATKRWDSRTTDEVENKEIDAFLDDIIKVCKKHNMSISHEDCHGAFIIENFDNHNEQWLRAAAIGKDYSFTYLPGITTDAS